MKYLKIQNDGLLDIRLVALMGGTTKANDQYKIGQFGTGLKYALAFLFRNNLAFRIFVGEQEVKVHSEIEHIAGVDFEIICINNQRTSITTQMGKEWEAWMIIRELYCNALDEGGLVKEISTNPEGVDGKTTFYVQIDSQIQEVLDNWQMYFIHEIKPIFENSNVAIYPPGEHLAIYKQGVLIHKTKQKAVFRYDLKTASINELREFKGSVSHAIYTCLNQAPKEVLDSFLNTLDDYHYEGDDMDWSWFDKMQQNWSEVLGDAKICTQKHVDQLKGRGIDILKQGGVIKVPRNLYRALASQFKHVSAVTIASEEGEFFDEYNEETDKIVKKALAILESANYYIHKDLMFRYGIFTDKKIQAMVLIPEKQILVSNVMFQKPLSTVVAMLIEENEHFMTGFNDCSRSFQQHFIDLYTRQLLKAAEIEI